MVIEKDLKYLNKIRPYLQDITYLKNVTWGKFNYQ